MCVREGIIFKWREREIDRNKERTLHGEILERTKRKRKTEKKGINL